MCLTRCGWGLWREKNEWWLREPKRGLLDGNFLVNSALNVKWLVKPRLLSPVGPRDSGPCATDISWNDMFLFEEGIEETFLQVLSIGIPVLADRKRRWKPRDMQENTKLNSFRELEDNFFNQAYYVGFCDKLFRLKGSQRIAYLCKIALSWRKKLRTYFTLCCLCCLETGTKQVTMACEHNEFKAFKAGLFRQYFQLHSATQRNNLMMISSTI